MRKIFLSAILFCLTISGFAERTTIDLKNNNWFIGINNPLSVSEFQNKISAFSQFDVTTLPQQKNENHVICTILNLTPGQAGKLIVSIEQGNNFFDVLIDGKRVENKLQNEDILCESDCESETGKILLTLKMKPGASIDETKLFSILQNVKIASLTGIFISEAIPQKDQYFGCPMLQIHVSNFLGKDIDGKLYARIFNFENHELISENNNCAFSRNGQESIIDVIFPEIKTTFIGKYSVEIQLVDKENNEEIIDQLFVPVEFK